MPRPRHVSSHSRPVADARMNELMSPFVVYGDEMIVSLCDCIVVDVGSVCCRYSIIEIGPFGIYGGENDYLVLLLLSSIVYLF